MAKWGGLGSITSALPSDLRNFLQRVRETLDLAMAGANRFVTVNDLVSGNVAATDARGNVIALDSALYDATPPPAPTGLVTAGALTTIMLQWDTPGYGNHAHTEIWRAATDNLGVAALIGTASGVLYADSVDAGSSYFYWARFVSRASIEGAYNATAGVNGTTSQDPTELLAILTDQITSSQLHATLGSRINLIDAVNTGLVTQVGTASQSIDDMAAALIQSTLDKADLLDRLARERAISDATVTIDPLTGSVTLLAEAAITTDVEARITTVETSVNAAAGTANTAISRLDVIGTVDEFGNPQNGVLNAMNTAINANTDGIALKADSAYIDSAVLAINANVETAVLSPVALMRLFLAGGNAIPIMQAAHIRVANAEQTLTTHTDQLVAEAQARLTLAALVDQNIAAILSEQTARADADSALASDITQVQARLDTGDFAAVKVESSASASAVTGLKAQYTIKLDADGKVSGYGAYADEFGSAFEIRADKIIFAAPSGGTANSITPFVVDTVNNLVVMDGAYIKNATIGNAKIANLAVDNAKIANMSANKITAGSIAVGEYIQSTGYVSGSSGWRIHGDGSAEFANIYARGNIRATSFSAITLQQGEHIKYGQTAYNTGVGFFIGDNGSGTPVLSLGNSSGSLLAWDGTNIHIRTPGFTWDGTDLTINGGGTFAGSLSAATGTFAGTLTADAVNAVNTINLSGQAVTIPAGVSSNAAAGMGDNLSYLFTSTGAPVLVVASVNASYSVSHGVGMLVMDLYRDGTLLGSAVCVTSPLFSTASPYGSGSVVAVDNPGMGDHKYKVTTRITGGGTGTFRNGGLLMLEVKR